MKSGILIIARVGSTRLSRKHLIKAAGKPFIQWLAERYLWEFENEVAKNEVKIIIATASDQENEIFESLFTGSAVSVFYGSSDNIPLRQLECAKSFGLDNILSIDGDDVLCSVSASRTVYSKLCGGTKAIKTAGLPLGMNLMGYSLKFLEESLTDGLRSGTLETGWGRIFKDDSFETINLGKYNLDERLRFTLDYEDDAIFFQKIIEGLNKQVLAIKDENLIQYVIENKLYEINAGLNDSYWNNFNSQKNREA